MSVHTLCIFTFKSEATWSHASNGGQYEIIILAQFARVIMVAILVGAFALQVVKVTEFQFLKAIQVFSRNALEIKPVDALAVSISFHCL